MDLCPKWCKCVEWNFGENPHSWHTPFRQLTISNFDWLLLMAQYYERWHKTYLLWLRFNTSKDLAFSSPSGTSLSLLWERSKVVSSSNLNSSAGIPELFTLLCLTFNERRHFNSVNSPNNFSKLLFFMDKFSYKNNKINTQLLLTSPI